MQAKYKANSTWPALVSLMCIIFRLICAFPHLHTSQTIDRDVFDEGDAVGWNDFVRLLHDGPMSFAICGTVLSCECCATLVLLEQEIGVLLRGIRLSPIPVNSTIHTEFLPNKFPKQFFQSCSPSHDKKTIQQKTFRSCNSFFCRTKSGQNKLHEKT